MLQKYIASMREQSERGMEKVREFIAKEKTRNEATTRKLINEHEKILSNHKKELNKIVYSINRFYLWLRSHPIITASAEGNFIFITKFYLLPHPFSISLPF